MTREPTPLAARVCDALAALAPAGSCCLVAVSGGPDSIALLDLLHSASAAERWRLVVGHVDHGISPESTAVAGRVAAQARDYGFSFVTVRLELGAGCSETRARVTRRAALRHLAREAGAEWIVLAHHADDQAETVLLRVLRGTGPAGLAAMRPRQGRWLRPLLGVRRAELAEHLATRGIVAWDDPANRDPVHLRSWLRSGIIPLLAERLPDLVPKLLEVASQAADFRDGWEGILDLLPGLQVAASARAVSVAAPPLQGYRSATRHAVLAAIGRRFGVPLGARRLEAIDRLLRSRRGSGRIRVARGVEVELAFGRLSFRRPDRKLPATGIALTPGGVAILGQIRVAVGVAPGVPPGRTGWETALTPGAYEVRAWRPGDRIRPLGGRGSRAVAVLLREARVPPGRRPEWPVVASTDDATIVWVPGICRSDSRVPEEGAEALHVQCAFA